MAAREVIRVESVSKQYRLGKTGTGTLSHDLNRWWHQIQGKEDPYLKIGEMNDRTRGSESGYVWALRDINFSVHQGEVLGIIGRNGAGKSTLLKILSRTTLPTTGSIRTRGRIASLLEVGTGFHPEMTGRENIFMNGAILGMRRREIQQKLDEIIDFSGVEAYIDTPVKRYSSGMYVRLAFAVAAHLESEILIVDEVLAVGDAEFQYKCLGKIKTVAGRGRTVLLVSHDLSMIRSLSSEVILLDKGLVNLKSEPETALDKYMNVEGISHSCVFPTAGEKPRITRIELDLAELKKGNLFIKIWFKSQDVIEFPMVGFVVYDAMGFPLFGSNPRFHSSGYPLIKVTGGRADAKVFDLGLHAGIYRISFWLGDRIMDYDFKESAIVFEFLPKVHYVQRPSPTKIGAIDKPAIWNVFEILNDIEEL